MKHPIAQQLTIVYNDRGFTIIEVLIAIVILSIALLGMAGLTMGIMAGNDHSKLSTTAVTLAQDKMEEVRRLGYSGIPSTDTTATENYSAISGYPLFKRTTVTVVDSPSAGMKTVTVTVYWNSDARSAELKTILAL